MWSKMEHALSPTRITGDTFCQYVPAGFLLGTLLPLPLGITVVTFYYVMKLHMLIFFVEKKYSVSTNLSCFEFCFDL